MINAIGIYIGVLGDSGAIPTGITADSTLYTSDSTLITADNG